jgi:hypothetical protein
LPLDAQPPGSRNPFAARSASSGRISTLRTARTVARRLAMMAKSRINRRVLRLGRLGRFFSIPILELRASIPSPSEILAVRLHAPHSHFSLSLLKKRKNEPSEPPELFRNSITAGLSGSAANRPKPSETVREIRIRPKADIRQSFAARHATALPTAIVGRLR